LIYCDKFWHIGRKIYFLRANHLFTISLICWHYAHDCPRNHKEIAANKPRLIQSLNTWCEGQSNQTSDAMTALSGVKRKQSTSVTNLMAIFEKLSKALDQYCAYWPNWDARSAQAQIANRRLTKYLASVPLLSMSNLAANSMSLTLSAQTLSIAALAIGIPAVAIALLSKFHGETLRKGLTVALGPAAFMLITQGHLNTLPIALMILSVMAHEAYKLNFERFGLAVSAVCTVTLASICFASNFDFIRQSVAAIGLLPVVLAGFAYVKWNGETRTTPVISSGSPFEIASKMANETGAVVFEIDQKANVLGLSSNSFDVLALDFSDLRDTAFLQRVHIADKVILLSQIDAVANGYAQGQLKIRMKANTGASNSSSWISTSCTVIENADCLLLFMTVLEETNANPLEQGGGVSKSALTIVSHELRTPLNAIIGFSDLMGKGLAGEIANERQREYVGLIHQSGQHLLALVNSILDISKLENGTFELAPSEFLPQQAAEFAISMLATQARNKQIGLQYLPLCGLDEFCGDKLVTQQIIINLLSNAVKFTPQNGRIDLNLEMDGDRLMITVADNGLGMSKDDLSKVGTPFYQANSNLSRQQEGAGLGLSLVRQLATRHGGAIEISSELGKGTSVRVALASLNKKRTVVSYLKHKEADESVRFIQIIEERNHGPLRKTA
jgi:signal transduction histidine kinase